MAQTVMSEMAQKSHCISLLGLPSGPMESGMVGFDLQHPSGRLG